MNFDLKLNLNFYNLKFKEKKSFFLFSFNKLNALEIE